MSFNIGEMVGPYRIIEQLGQGGMATVYKAYHAALDRYVAIKVLHPAFLEDTSFLARFQREARLVAKLEHPNIVPIYDYTEHEGRPYLVMKFIEGETLKATLARAPIARDEIAHIVDSVGAGLAYAHKRGILHRDIKPSNVLMATDGQIYLSDFGLARIAQSGESTLTSDMILGTPQYISPEQALGKKDLDEGTDIYSFGVMLYELVVGKVPFSADTPFSVIHDHIYTPLPMPHIANPDISDNVERVLLKSLAKERRDRYKDVHSMVQAFQEAWKESAPTSPDETLTQQAKTVVVPDPAAASTASEVPTIVPLPIPLPGDESTLSAAAVPTLAAGTDTGSQPASQVQVQKPKSGALWMWLSVVTVLVLGGLVTFYAIRSIRKLGGSVFPSIPTGIQTVLPFQTPGAVPELAKAEQFAQQNPNDPKALLQLALADVDANLPSQAEDTVTSIEKLASKDESFYWDAARQLAGKKAWLPAARLAVDAAEHNPNPQKLPDDLKNQLDSTVYQAFRDPKAVDAIPIDRLSKIDPILAKTAEVRFTLYNGSTAEARILLDQFRVIHPLRPEIPLLQAEIAIKAGDNAMAKVALANLRKNTLAVQWMLDEAKNLEGKIP
jgi:serine/threonine protein kinase